MDLLRSHTKVWYQCTGLIDLSLRFNFKDQVHHSSGLLLSVFIIELHLLFGFIAWCGVVVWYQLTPAQVSLPTPWVWFMWESKQAIVCPSSAPFTCVLVRSRPGVCVWIAISTGDWSSSSTLWVIHSIWYQPLKQHSSLSLSNFWVPSRNQRKMITSAVRALWVSRLSNTNSHLSHT